MTADPAESVSPLRRDNSVREDPFTTTKRREYRQRGYSNIMLIMIMSEHALSRDVMTPNNRFKLVKNPRVTSTLRGGSLLCTDGGRHSGAAGAVVGPRARVPGTPVDWEADFVHILTERRTPQQRWVS